MRSVLLYFKQHYPVIAGIADINAVLPDKKPSWVSEITHAQC